MTSASSSASTSVHRPEFWSFRDARDIPLGHFRAQDIMSSKALLVNALFVSVAHLAFGRVHYPPNATNINDFEVALNGTGAPGMLPFGSSRSYWMLTHYYMAIRYI